MKVKDIIRDLEEIAPPRLADEGDMIGLQVGDPEADVTKLLVAVDPTPAVVDHSIESGAQMLICHHPLIYKPIEMLASGEPVRDRLIKLIRAGAALYIMHTNYDSVVGGTNDVLADLLGVKVIGLLTVRRRERKLKVVVFAPDEDASEVRNAMAQAGAGVIGDYTDCSFMAPGTGTFKPMPDAEPYIGQVGNLEEAVEIRIEMSVPEWRLGPVLDAMIQAHPYEEVAYDIYPLENEPYYYGYGRVGSLEPPINLSEFRRIIEDKLNSHEIRMIGNPDMQVNRVALCSGGGKSLLKEAHASRADVYVTGDIGYHDFLTADALGLAVIDAGHYETERPGMEALAKRLSQKYSGEILVI